MSVKIGNGVTSIGSFAFYSCSSLTSVTIPDSVTNIGYAAFYSCSSLWRVKMGNGVTSIDSYAFQQCTNLTSVTIPDSVTNIGSGAFYKCTSLTIYCEASRKPSGWVSNWNYSNLPVVWDCKNNDVATDGCIYTEIDGIRYALKAGQARVPLQAKDITIANILASITYKDVAYTVTSIVSCAFCSCTSLTSVTFGENSQLTSIGS